MTLVEVVQWMLARPGEFGVLAPHLIIKLSIGGRILDAQRPGRDVPATLRAQDVVATTWQAMTWEQIRTAAATEQHE